MKIFLDMDGVLADHDKYVCNIANVNNWKEITKQNNKEIYNIDNLFENFEKTTHADYLISKIVEMFGEYHILSKLPNQKQVEAGMSKLRWIRNNLLIKPLSVTFPYDKSLYAKGNILIDDYGKNIKSWEAAGGVGIKYKFNSKNYTIHDIILKLEQVCQCNT